MLSTRLSTTSGGDGKGKESINQPDDVSSFFYRDVHSLLTPVGGGGGGQVGRVGREGEGDCTCFTQSTSVLKQQNQSLKGVLTTNDKKIFYKRKLIDSNRCTFSKTEKETINHLLWDWTYTETFWKYVLEWITKNTPHIRG